MCVVRGSDLPATRRAADQGRDPAVFGGLVDLPDSGYVYNTTTAWSWRVGIDMGSLADCGSGSYRAWGYAALYQGGAWRGSSLTTLALPLR